MSVMLEKESLKKGKTNQMFSTGIYQNLIYLH